MNQEKSIRQNRRAKLCVIAAVLGVSFSAVLVRSSSAPSQVLVFYRLGLAALFMSVPGISGLRRERKSISKLDLVCCVISGVFLALHFWAYFAALKLTGIASAVVLVDAEVFFVALCQRLFFHEKISGSGLIGILITFAGSVIIALGDSSGMNGSLKGDLIALSGAFFMAVYTIMGRICRKHMSTSLYTGLVYYVTAGTSFVILLVQKIPVFGYSRKDFLAALGMAVLCTLLGHNIFSWGLKYLPPSYISTVKLLEPVFASLLGILFFREMPLPTAVLGGVVVIAGIWLTGRNN